jgi:alanine dehydrogenase
VIVGTVRERKTEEHRVGLTPEGADNLVRAGHRVLVEAGAGAASGFPDEEYVRAGGEIAADAEDVWATAHLLVKVKEPMPSEYDLMRPGLTLFTYLHLATTEGAADALLRHKVTSIAYETVELADGSLPLLVPMSEIAGRMATEIAAQLLRKPGPGRGKLLSGLPGSPPARVVILGAGTVSTAACGVAVALGAQITVLSIGFEPLRAMERRWPGRVTTLPSNPATLEQAIAGADVVISGVLVPGGARAPTLIDRAGLRSMGPGAVIVDVSIDQGGVFETSRPTTHAEPTFVEEGVVHYCVANMPGAVPRTSTAALTAATFPYVLKLADLGAAKALSADPALAKGLMTRDGQLVNKEVARALGR